MLFGAEEGAAQDTWTLRFSDTVIDVSAFVAEVADVLRPFQNGADIQTGYGVWDGQIEESVTVTLQAEETVVEVLLNRISQAFPQFQFIHVERGYAATQYVDLNVRREVLALDARREAVA